MFRPNRSHPLNQGKVHWWICQPDAMGGLVLFDLMDNSRGTLTGYAAGYGWAASARPGGMASLRSSTTAGYVDIGASNAKLPASATQFSYGIWVKFNTFNASYSNPIFRGDASGGMYGIIVTPGGVWNAQIGGAGVNGATLSTNRWYHLFVTYNAGTATLYQDGRSVASGSASPVTSISRYQIGTDSANNRYVDGWYDDVAIYSRSLSAAEVRALYDQSTAGHPDTLVRPRPPRYAMPAPAASPMIPWHLLLGRAA